MPETLACKAKLSIESSGVTAKAISHRIYKIKEKALQYVREHPYKVDPEPLCEPSGKKGRRGTAHKRKDTTTAAGKGKITPVAAILQNDQDDNVSSKISEAGVLDNGVDITFDRGDGVDDEALGERFVKTEPM